MKNEAIEDGEASRAIAWPRGCGCQIRQVAGDLPPCGWTAQRTTGTCLGIRIEDTGQAQHLIESCGCKSWWQWLEGKNGEMKGCV
ncbi:hypothetical protein PTE30175_01841 [Pandoraea terrae]|uniref:Uncharacterized protein n=1 Tax=Pandoraea terrae TaxID=1537710 RepID=A0A5E4U9D7_9BURK|nr:hypothetical protein PTE30175_01841 [Pandoraea terrae]